MNALRKLFQFLGIEYLLINVKQNSSFCFFLKKLLNKICSVIYGACIKLMLKKKSYSKYKK